MKGDHIIQSRVAVMLAAVLLFCGCAAQKNTRPRDEKAIAQQVLYTQARQALDARRFRIELIEYYPADVQKSRGACADSHLSMKGTFATLQVQQFTHIWLNIGTLIDCPAEIVLAKTKRSGEVQYQMKIDGGQPWQQRQILISLYPDSNRCVVRVNDEQHVSNAVYYTGEVYPLVP